ncbi:hypothetical protein RhiirA4_477659 [Rhizophagus irregularis]|uniref:Uncharacterized protein n=1 Tax=Rhizophagus irregularis TaxID=588596 RepID=A0A2I1HDK0_9GLOM|nr:hypothetical protein RhiirA4_477659 [Rhizophagus irregularis]
MTQMVKKQTTDSTTTMKLANINKGIARYNIIFLPEFTKYDLIRISFNDEGWRNFEDMFIKRNFSQQWVNDVQQLKQKLETFDIQVDRRDFPALLRWSLLDEINLSFIIPNSPMQLFFLEEIVQKLLEFKARVIDLNTRITNLLKCATVRNHRRRKISAVEASPPDPSKKFRKLNK